MCHSPDSPGFLYPSVSIRINRIMHFSRGNNHIRWECTMHSAVAYVVTCV